ncbi:MAG: hypothetical protein HFE77_03440 [Clostridiales bacterium]|nr:hypothetical protein [Clostridiales bacterium]
MKVAIKELRSFNFALFAALCALSIVPAIYQTLKTFLISSNVNFAFDIIGQMEWFDLINETLQAFLIIPLYSVLNKILNKEPEHFAENVFKTGILTFCLYGVFSVGVFIYGINLVSVMNPAEFDLTVTVNYLRLETVAFMAGIIVSFVNVIFVVVGKVKNVYLFLVTRTVLSVIVDFLLIPKMGVYGVAVSNIIVNGILAITSVILLYLQKQISPCKFCTRDHLMLKEWAKTGVFSGLQQFVDNWVYAIMICKMVNIVAEQGNYWIANNFIWGWLLIPITALTEVIRKDGENYRIKHSKFNYCFIAACTIVLWMLTIPLWKPFFIHAEHLRNANEVFNIVIKLVPFYIAYAGCAIIDNIFISLGKTIYPAINSLIINVGYYGIFYLLYLNHTIDFSMNVIIVMFGFGMVVHLIISIIEEKIFLKKAKNTDF